MRLGAGSFLGRTPPQDLELPWAPSSLDTRQGLDPATLAPDACREEGLGGGPLPGFVATPHCAMYPADCVTWYRVLWRELWLRALREGQLPSVASAAKLLSVVMASYRGLDLCVAMPL